MGSKSIHGARIMSYEDIAKAQEKREVKETNTLPQPRRGCKRQAAVAVKDQPKRPRFEEAERAHREVEAWGLNEYGSMLQF